MGVFAKVNELIIGVITENIMIGYSINKRVLSVFGCEANRGDKNEKNVEPIDNGFS